jgi:hypothetical protein
MVVKVPGQKGAPLGVNAGGGRLSISGVESINAAQLGLGGTAVGTLQHDQTVAGRQFGGGAGVTSIGQHSHLVSLTGSSRASGLGPILAFTITPDVMMDAGGFP